MWNVKTDSENKVQNWIQWVSKPQTFQLKRFKKAFFGYLLVVRFFLHNRIMNEWDIGWKMWDLKEQALKLGIFGWFTPYLYRRPMTRYRKTKKRLSKQIFTSYSKIYFDQGVSIFDRRLHKKKTQFYNFMDIIKWLQIVIFWNFTDFYSYFGLFEA